MAEHGRSAIFLLLTNLYVSWKRKELSTVKINDSAVALAGKRSYSKFQETHVESAVLRADQLKALQEENKGFEVSISDKSKSLLEQLKEKQKEDRKNADKRLFEHLKATNAPKETDEVSNVAETEEDSMLEVLRRVLAMLKSMRTGKKIPDYHAEKPMTPRQLSGIDKHFKVGSSASFSMQQSLSVTDVRSSGNVSNGAGTTWIRHTEKSGFVMEQERVLFSATGLVHTADGREIEFGVDLNMSRGFAGAFFESSDTQVVLTDPLVINLDSASASVSDMSFYFDLDADGKEEEVSSLGSGSGFLAYDKNHDGKINDGSELFGTKSGDGFKDLEAYDEDGNGWIDENDKIFNHLKVWVKNEDGTDRLLDLKEANVGAIHLGNADTQFHLNEQGTNKTQAVIQKTGVFLKETGEVGTVQHVDLAV